MVTKEPVGEGEKEGAQEPDTADQEKEVIPPTVVVTVAKAVVAPGPLKHCTEGVMVML